MANRRYTGDSSPNGGRGAVKKPAGAPPQIINQKIEIRPYHRQEQDIPKWRQAIQSAESQIPHRNLLYNLYADVDLDGHVEAVTGKRRDPIKAANWQFVDKEGMPVDEINDVIDTIGFDELLEEIINSRFWGYSILEPKFWKDSSDKWQMDAGLIPRLNYRPEIGVVSFDIHGNDGINIREGIYARSIMEVGKVIDLGLYMKAAPYAILKRGGWGDYAAFIQTFGSPLIDATWDGFDEKQRLQLQLSLDNIGAGGVIVRPEGTTIEVKENNVSSTGNAHGDFISGLNKEISKALLGSTETTESSTSSGYAQAETHQDQDDLKHMNDLAYCRKVLNSRFIRILQSYAFDTKGGEFIIQGEEQELTKKESFELHKSMKTELNLPMDDDFFYETYGVPKPENYEQLKKLQEAPHAPEGGAPEKPKTPEGVGKEPDKKKPGDDDKAVELTEKHWYIKLFERFFVEAPEVKAGAISTCGDHHTINLFEGDAFDNDGLIGRIWEAKGKAEFDGQLFHHTANVLILGFKKGWDEKNKIELTDAPGFMYGYNDPALMTAYEQNLFRFSGAKTLWEAQQLNSIFRNSTSFEKFYQAGKKFLDKSRKDYLETEYNSAVLTGQSAATYNRLMAQVDIFPYWKYTTAGDKNVRPEHASLNGLILPANDPIWDRLFPPNGWNCRCYIVPRMRHEWDESELEANRARANAYLDSPRFEREAKSGWGVNRGKAQLVFSEVQRYAKNGKDPDFSLNKLGPADYGLSEPEALMRNSNSMMPLYAADAGEFYDGLENFGGGKVLRDYHSRPVSIEKEVIATHKAKLLQALRAGLLSADEVWMQENQLMNYTFIKYYMDVAIQIKVKLLNGQLSLVSWLDVTPGKIGGARNGLYIGKQ